MMRDLKLNGREIRNSKYGRLLQRYYLTCPNSTAKRNQSG
jgi:hypothetical protein